MGVGCIDDHFVVDLYFHALLYRSDSLYNDSFFHLLFEVCFVEEHEKDIEEAAGIVERR